MVDQVEPPMFEVLSLCSCIEVRRCMRRNEISERGKEDGSKHVGDCFEDDAPL